MIQNMDRIIPYTGPTEFDSLLRKLGKRSMAGASRHPICYTPLLLGQQYGYRNCAHTLLLQFAAEDSDLGFRTRIVAEFVHGILTMLSSVNRVWLPLLFSVKA